MLRLRFRKRHGQSKRKWNTLSVTLEKTQTSTGFITDNPLVIALDAIEWSAMDPECSVHMWGSQMRGRQLSVDGDLWTVSGHRDRHTGRLGVQVLRKIKAYSGGGEPETELFYIPFESLRDGTWFKNWERM